MSVATTFYLLIKYDKACHAVKNSGANVMTMYDDNKDLSNAREIE